MSIPRTPPPTGPAGRGVGPAGTPGAAGTGTPPHAGASAWLTAWWVVPALVALTVLPRAILALRLEAVCRDAHFYQMLAGRLRGGDVGGGLEFVGLNLYVGLAALLGALGDAAGLGAINALLIWGVLAAGLTVVPLYDWVRRQFGAAAAVAATVAFAVHPSFIEIGVEPIRDGTFWLLVAAALAALHRAADPTVHPAADPAVHPAAGPAADEPDRDGSATAAGRLRWFALFGLAATAAVLTRSEGWMLLAPLVGWTALAAWRRPGQRRTALAGAALALAVGPVALIAVNLTLLHGHDEWEWGRLSVMKSIARWSWAALAGPAPAAEPLATAGAALAPHAPAGDAATAALATARDMASESISTAPARTPLWQVYAEGLLGSFKPALLILCGAGMLAFRGRLGRTDVWPLWAVNAAVLAAVAQRLMQHGEMNGRYFLLAALLALPTAGLVLCAVGRWACARPASLPAARWRGGLKPAAIGAALLLAGLHVADGLQAAHPRRGAERRAAVVLRGRLTELAQAEPNRPATPRVWGLGIAAHLATEVGGDVRTAFDGIDIQEARAARPDLIVLPRSSGRPFDFEQTGADWLAAGFRPLDPPASPGGETVWSRMIALVPGDAAPSESGPPEPGLPEPGLPESDPPGPLRTAVAAPVAPPQVQR